MRYLNRIIFINSAHIKYAEINLDGNVHFIGTQGVGKSTLLRAILFFYNADTLGLGIPKQKKPYPDYYFQHSNSYVIYEVVRNEEKFCVVSYKSQHKICFRFFDGEYKSTYFVGKGGNVPDNWEGIAQQLDDNEVFYTKRKIDEYKEYRDILYGNNDGKRNELKRYSLLESKEYQYLPKTIQNVFLNSKMEAEFIKQTIIMSLENDIRIDLNSYTRHLKDFETHLTDIRKFKTPTATSQANSIANLHIAIKYLGREKIHLAKELSWVLIKIQEQEPGLVTRLEKERKIDEKLKNKLNNASELYKSKERKILSSISVFDDKLKDVKKLTEKYEKINIAQIIEKVSKKASLDSEQRNLSDEKELLSIQFKELTQKFQALLDKLQNQRSEFENQQDAKKLKINSGFLVSKDEIKQDYEKMISDIRTNYKNDIDGTRGDYENKKQSTNNLKIKKEGIKHQKFFEREIETLKTEIESYNKTNQKLILDNENFVRHIESLQKNWEFDEKDLLKSFEREKERSELSIETANGRIVEIDSYIENSKDSLYGWLTEQYPGWENTIGKVIDEKNVLFNSDLTPKFLEKTNTFYGIELNLSAINKAVTTVADYEKEKSELNLKIDEVKNQISELREITENNKENLKKKYQPKIREKKDIIKENGYVVEQNEAKLLGAKAKLNELIIKADTEKKNAIDLINKAIEEAAEVEIKAKNDINKLEGELSKLIKNKENERDRKIGDEQEKIKLGLIDIEAETKVQIEAIDKRKGEIILQKENELSSKGADTKRLDVIDSRLEEIKEALDFIEENRDTVSDYKKDKRELFDKVEEFKYKKLTLEKELEQEEKKYNRQKETIAKELEDVKSIIESVTKSLSEIKEDNDAFGNFKGSECYNTIEEYFTSQAGEFKTEKRVKTLIDDIREIHYEKLHQRTEDIKETINDFLDKFSEDNVFKFKKKISNTKAFLDFAEMLSDFIEEKKIERIEKEVNERFALIISTIGTEATSLLSEAGQIQKVINKINSDFIDKNFAGVIKKIELKVDESKNEVVQLLIMIKQYNDDNTLELGAPNLFSSESQEKKNKDAVDLLKQFVKKIGENKADYISLTDSFELKFRIEENQNDTGWVEKLSNVGSDGTDVLVKAMVNIMLLNVFKEGVSKRFKDFQLHCMMDEIGKLHPNNVRGILKFANDRNILLINSSPIENDALSFKHIYKLKKEENGNTRVNRIITQYSE